jgi:hypothetical protein
MVPAKNSEEPFHDPMFSWFVLVVIAPVSAADATCAPLM